MKPILLISDTHYHNFTAYSQLTATGINTRLADILRATIEAAMALRAAGGDIIIHSGDTFHLRGSISPTVLNPVLAMYRKLTAQGFKVFMISGNHDLETENSNELASSITALEGAGVIVISEYMATEISGNIWHFIPWVKDLAELRQRITKISQAIDVPGTHNLVLHAPLNGVITGLPNHGLSPKEFDDSGFKRVFCGHYHNHMVFPYEGGHIASVGALTHQSWSDADNLAGYCIYNPRTNELEHFETAAPQFVKVDFADLDAIHDAYLTDNYVKVVGGNFTDPDDIATIKADLTLRGAKAVTVEGLTRKPVATRGAATSTEAPSLDSILGDYIDRTYPGETETKTLALNFLRQADSD